MKYVVFTRNPYSSTPLASWIGDVDRDTIVITKKIYEEEYSKFFETIGLEDYDSEKSKCDTIKQICKTSNITHIGALSEFDLISVAKAREVAGVVGQSVLSATCFRNKLLMKKYVASSGIPVPKYSCIRNINELKTFISSVGFPIILKPIDGAGSLFTKKISNEKEVSKINENDFQSPLLAEEYIFGEMLHVDGIFDKGEISSLSISKYYGSCLSHQIGEALGSYQLDKNIELWKEVEKFLLQVLGALPCPQVMGFHAEFFQDAEGKLVFCEIASRLGGGRIIDCIMESHGLNLAKYWIRSQLGLTNPEITTKNNFLPHGFALIPPRKGILKLVPDKYPFNWIKGYSKNHKAGDVLNDPDTSVDNVVSYIVFGNTPKQIKERLRESMTWFNINITYE